MRSKMQTAICEGYDTHHESKSVDIFVYFVGIMSTMGLTLLLIQSHLYDTKQKTDKHDALMILPYHYLSLM